MTDPLGRLVVADDVGRPEVLGELVAAAVAPVELAVASAPGAAQARCDGGLDTS